MTQHSAYFNNFSIYIVLQLQKFHWRHIVSSDNPDKYGFIKTDG